MIEEKQAMTVRFKLFGPRVGETILFGMLQFIDGLLEVQKTDAVNIERALRPYSACLESEWEARQAAWEKAQEECPVVRPSRLSPGFSPSQEIEISGAIERAVDDAVAIEQEALAQFKLDTEEQVKQLTIELSEKFETEKAEAVKVAVEAALAKAAPTPAKEAKPDGTSKDSKSTK